MKHVNINDKEYQVLDNVKDGLELEELKKRLTDYFNDYDYIVGDWAYNKLRLKGFYDEHNKKVKKLNNIKFLNNYLKKSCAYGCRYFLLKRVYKK